MQINQGKNHEGRKFSYPLQCMQKAKRGNRNEGHDGIVLRYPILNLVTTPIASSRNKPVYFDLKSK